MSELADRIKALLLANPGGLKARDIGKRLGVAKEEVNSVLYGDLWDAATQDNEFVWRMQESAAGTAHQSAPFEASHALGRLCSYYLDCLSHDDMGGVSVFAKSTFGDKYVEVESIPEHGASTSALFSSQAAGRLLRNARAFGRGTVVFGYPVQLKRIRSKKGWEGFVLEPVLLFQFAEGGHGGAPPLSDDLPRLNPAAVASLAHGGQWGVAEELAQLSEELGIGSAATEMPELDELLARLRRLRPEWPWQEELDPTALSPGAAVGDLNEAGIFNRAVLVSVERSPYTKGLETELQNLKKVSSDKYQPTALGKWVTHHGPTPEKSSQPEPLLEVLPLNTEQRNAVRSALSQDLTVITGPPGTGKSQVVTSILTNAAYRGQTVLFASKNNKAVDVVEVRVNDLGSRPILLRVGANEYQSRLANHLVTLLGATATREDKEEHDQAIREHAGLQARAASLDEELDRLVALRNRVDRLEQGVEASRELLGPTVFARIRGAPLSAIDKSLATLRTSASGADRSRQGALMRMCWPLVRRRRLEALNAAASPLRDAAQYLDVAQPPAAVDDIDCATWEAFANTLEARAAAAASVATYLRSLAELKAGHTFEDIAAARRRLTGEIADSSERVWQTWLRLLPSRLKAADRRLLGDFAAVLQLLAAANRENRTAGKDVLKKYNELTPKVASILPCWAVTSLSAKGRVPFEPNFADLLVIDEASQCDIASALPLLFRARRVVIIGDPQQLRHISALPKAADQQLLRKHEVLADFAGWAYSARSLFDLASSLCESEDIVVLRDHHRSHADIIEFSNREFYEGRLRVATRYDRLARPRLDEPAVRWVDVSGRVVRPSAGGAMNDVEARAVVAELIRLVRQGYRGSIGVVSPFRAQANRIRDLIASQQDVAAIAAQLELQVDTVHKFQGDERDVILFSPVVSAEVSDSALGFLRSTPNLFNVAISRARAALVVVGDQGAAARSGVDYLERFAAYCSELGSPRFAQPKAATSGTSGPEYPRVSNPERVSDWERLFYKALYDHGLRPLVQYPVEKYLLDLALFDGDRRLAIEVDGEQYHRDWSGDLCRRDQLRNLRLMELGWDVQRFWVYQLRDDMAWCIERVKSWFPHNRSASPSDGHVRELPLPLQPS